MSLNLTVIINRFRRSAGVGLMKSAFLPSDSIGWIFYFIFLQLGLHLSFFVLFVCNSPPPLFLFFCLPTFLDVFVSRPVGRFLTGVALAEAFLRHQTARSETGSVTLCGALSSPALIESSDPKLMRGGTGAHLLSAQDVLHRQAAEPQWQCWIRSVGSDNTPPHPIHPSLDILLIICNFLKDVWVNSSRAIGEKFPFFYFLFIINFFYQIIRAASSTVGFACSYIPSLCCISSLNWLGI